MNTLDFITSVANRAVKNPAEVLVQVAQCSMAVGSQEIYRSLEEKLPASIAVDYSGCDGACFAGPKIHSEKDVSEYLEGIRVTSTGDANVRNYIDSQTRIVLEHAGNISASDIYGYIANKGFSALANVLSQPPEQTVDMVEESGLRGRGGAYFPVSIKWRSAMSTASKERHIEIIAEEGEPGVFKDRHVMESVPFRLIEGALIAAYATKSTSIRLYVNAEAHLSYQRMLNALEICRSKGFLGPNIMGSGFTIDIEILKGAGGYVCGEESTLLNTIEGKRREPRLRPPFPTESGLNQQPTIINNVETLCNLPWIVLNGADEFKKIGDPDTPGTKILSISGSVNTPGVAELPMGSNLAELLVKFGGISSINTLSAIAVGGPSSGVIPSSESLNLSIGPGFLDGKSVMLGAGGVIGLSQDTNVLEVVRKLSEYNAKESCGKCTPCREGTTRLLELMANDSGDDAIDWNGIGQLAEVINAASLCGLGQAAGNPVLSYGSYFQEVSPGSQGGGI